MGSKAKWWLIKLSFSSFSVTMGLLYRFLLVFWDSVKVLQLNTKSNMSENPRCMAIAICEIHYWS